MPGPEERERRRLEALPPVSIPIQEAPLHAAIQLISTAAGMNYLAPDPASFSETITLSVRLNPWRLLQILAEKHRFEAFYREGVWLFRRDNPGLPVARTYTLRHTNLDVYKASQNSFNLLSSDTQTSRGGQSGGEASGGMVFTPHTQKIIDDIRELVGLRAAREAGDSSPSAPAEGSAASHGAVLYLPDVNALYVSASPAQHLQIAQYLALVDQPVRQIRIEARFFETTHDPKLVLGIDPSGYQPGLTLSNIQTNIDTGRLRATPYPDKVLLAADTLRFQVSALQTDEKSRLINNPTVVVANNREAYFSVGDEEPFVSSNSISTGLLDGGLGSTQAHVAIRRIGTSVNLVPTLFAGLEGGQPRIRLAVRIEVGVLKGFRRINAVDVPVVSSQKYEYTVFLRAGETLAFGGLSGLAQSDSVKKIPLAGDIPVLGGVFRSRDSRSSQRNLVAYLTANLVEDGPAANKTAPVSPEGPESLSTPACRP
jgi:type II secretory pathway component GspD/PulD (secretin)